MKKLILAIFFTYSLSAHADVALPNSVSRSDIFDKIKNAIKNPAGARSILNPWGFVIDQGLDVLFDGIDSAAEQARNPTWTKDKISENKEQQSNSSTTKSGEWDYIFDDKLFPNPEAVRTYISGEYMSKLGWHFSRNYDGYYYQNWVVNYRDRTMTLYAQVAQNDDKHCTKYNDVCGWQTSFQGTMLPIGTISNKTTINTDEQALDIANEQVINDLSKRYEDVLKNHGISVVDTATSPTQDKDKDKEADNVTKPKPITTPTDGATTPTDGATTPTDGATTDKVTVQTGTQDKTKDNTATDVQTGTQEKDKSKDKENAFELPDFCDWAKSVCEFIDWTKAEPPQAEPQKQVPKATLSDLGLNDDELFKQRISFEGQCPKHELKFAINGNQIIEPIPTYHFCNLLEQIAPWLLAFSYLSAGFFVIRNL